MRFWRNKGKQRRQQWFLDNGSTFLKELIAGCNGKTNPIRSFSSDQILKATNGFDPSRYVTSDLYYTWYTGNIEGRSYMITMFPEEKVKGDGDGIGAVYNDIVISARVTSHSNFLKLLGCCLEFPFPVLVFEHAENRTLSHQGGIGSKYTEFLPWDVRLKVAKEIANAVTYLHTEFPKIIVHRNITPMNVLLDENWTAKLSDFRCCEKSVEKRPKMIDVANELKRIERSLS
ncbi:hypothetical protein EUTSA_v10006391mg [Eutrema salsugineum]|uniref:Protein kinase domain-containing protein n=1 Tax=Eutrema salsugineum TaxID=72664 RepID=V4NE14_EUTSA|nr:hypothetical protein EUTSA_v10006391mg [Eutrema salsugineum]